MRPPAHIVARALSAPWGFTFSLRHATSVCAVLVVYCLRVVCVQAGVVVCVKNVPPKKKRAGGREAVSRDPPMAAVVLACAYLRVVRSVCRDVRYNKSSQGWGVSE